MTNYSKITLVGAGPGDPELITIKGLKAIQSADVILYDALVHPHLLTHAPSHAIKYFVGKRAGKPYSTQEEINEKLIEFAQLGHVVRLKGGDPFVFGRGYEEVEAAYAANIPVDFVPGLSSSTSVSANNGISITLRNISKSFHVVTAVSKNGNLSKDLIECSKLSGTVIVLMGLGKLTEIVDAYKTIGKDNLGIAVIQNGTLNNQKAVFGKISNIQQQVTKSGIKTPAIIYIGEVINAYLEQSKNRENATKKSVVSGIFQA